MYTSEYNPEKDQLQVFMMGEPCFALTGGMALVIATTHSNLSRVDEGRASDYLAGVMIALSHTAMTGETPHIAGPIPTGGVPDLTDGPDERYLGELGVLTARAKERFKEKQEDGWVGWDSPTCATNMCDAAIAKLRGLCYQSEELEDFEKEAADVINFATFLFTTAVDKFDG